MFLENEQQEEEESHSLQEKTYVQIHKYDIHQQMQSENYRGCPKVLNSLTLFTFKSEFAITQALETVVFSVT